MKENARPVVARNEKAEADPEAYVAKIKAEAAAERERRQKLEAEKPPIDLLKRLATPASPYPNKPLLKSVPVEADGLKAEAADASGKASKEAPPREKPKPKLEITTSKALADDSRTAILGRTMAALNQLNFTFTYDLFRHRYQIGDHVLQQQIGENVEHAILVLRTNIIRQFNFDPGPEKIKAAVYRLCLGRAFNPVRDYLDRLIWDGKPRLDNWLSTYLGAADVPLNCAIGRKVLIAAVRRVRAPGTKFDQIMVLEGDQGTGKSSALKILAGEYFSDAEIIGLRSREVMELCSGVWIFELSELEGLGKRDVASVKAFASRTHDKARPAYGYAPVERARTCIFIGTCNPDEYLIDETGNRRFWPVATSKIDLNALSRDRDQLWAEAAMAEATGETLVMDAKLWGEAAALVDERMPDEPWHDLLAEVENMADAKDSLECTDAEIRVTSEFLLEQVLRFDRSRVRRTDTKRLAGVMKRLGWKKPKNVRIGSKVGKGYVKKIAK